MFITNPWPYMMSCSYMQEQSDPQDALRQVRALLHEPLAVFDGDGNPEPVPARAADMARAAHQQINLAAVRDIADAFPDVLAPRQLVSCHAPGTPFAAYREQCGFVPIDALYPEDIPVEIGDDVIPMS